MFEMKNHFSDSYKHELVILGALLHAILARSRTQAPSQIKWTYSSFSNRFKRAHTQSHIEKVFHGR